jgi:hypothetical protein
LNKFLTFLAKKSHFSENFWDLSGFLKFAVKYPKKIDPSPPPPKKKKKNFLNPYPPPKIFGQAHAFLGGGRVAFNKNFIGGEGIL